MNSKEIKDNAKKLKTLSKKYGYDIKHSHALEIISILDNKANWHVAGLENPDIIKTGLKSLDEDLGGGLQKGTLTSIVGGTNSGKTLTCLSLVSNSIRQKKKVLIFNLEAHSKEYYKKCILSNLSNIKLSKILKGDLTDGEKSILKTINEKILNKYLIIKDINSFDYAIEDLLDEVLSVRMSFKFDLLFVDYGQLLSVNNKAIQGKGSRHEIAKIYRDFHRLANAYDCAVITPVQATRSSAKTKKVLKSEDITEAFEIARVSSTIITVNKENDGLFLYLDKNRMGISGKEYRPRIDFSTVNLIKDFQKELNKLNFLRALNE